MSSDTDINGALLRLKREEMGWTLADMAARACLSTKQVKQLEDGGDSAFYSLAIKLTVAKKNAQILGITEDELFGQNLVDEETIELSSQTQSLAQDAIVQPELAQEMLATVPASPASKPGASTESLQAKAPLGAERPSQELKLDVQPNELAVTQPIAPVAPVTSSVTEANIKVEVTVTNAESEPTHPLKKPQTANLSEQISSVPLALSLPSNESHLSDSADTTASMGFGVKFLLALLVIFGLVLIVEPKAKDDFLDFFKNSGLITNSDSTAEREAMPVTLPLTEVPTTDSPVDETKSPIGPIGSNAPMPSDSSSSNSSAKVGTSSVPVNSNSKPDTGTTAQNPDNLNTPNSKSVNTKSALSNNVAPNSVPNVNSSSSTNSATSNNTTSSGTPSQGTLQTKE